MFAEQRLKKIREYLLEHNEVDINTLSSVISVSVSTLRRDLDKLEQDGYLSKHHGGVVLNKSAIENYFYASNDLNIEIKSVVGLVASELVNDHDIIFIGAGNSCWQMSKNLKAKGLTVVTHSFNVVMELMKQPDIKIVFLGGDVEVENNKSFTSGSFAVDTLKNVYIQKSFITANGVSLDFGYSINSNYLADLYTKLLDYSKNTMVLADYTKFDNRAFRQICPFDKIQHLITNKNIPEKYKVYCREKGISVYTNLLEEKPI